MTALLGGRILNPATYAVDVDLDADAAIRGEARPPTPSAAWDGITAIDSSAGPIEVTKSGDGPRIHVSAHPLSPPRTAESSSPFNAAYHGGSDQSGGIAYQVAESILRGDPDRVGSWRVISDSRRATGRVGITPSSPGRPPRWRGSPPRRRARPGPPGSGGWRSTIACRPAATASCGCRASGDGRSGRSSAPSPRRSAASRCDTPRRWCANQVISS